LLTNVTLVNGGVHGVH